jgi:hypothetical protein
MVTYVFDFYNLYLPKKYKNKEFGITIVPLKFAEEFEKGINDIPKRYEYGNWKTARCIIKGKELGEIKQIATWLEFLLSVAQTRSIFFLEYYSYVRGKKYWSMDSKHVEGLKNSNFEFVYGTLPGGAWFNREIDLFLNTALSTLNRRKNEPNNNIMELLHAYIISKSNMILDLKFLILWITLEKLANKYYRENNISKKLFSKEIENEIKTELKKTLENILKGHKRMDFMKDSISRHFLYEHRTLHKIKLYLNTLDLGFVKDELDALLEKLVVIRTNLVHDLDSAFLRTNYECYFNLGMLMEVVILRQLGINRQTQSRLLLHQYNIGPHLKYETENTK